MVLQESTCLLAWLGLHIRLLHAAAGNKGVAGLCDEISTTDAHSAGNRATAHQAQAGSVRSKSSRTWTLGRIQVAVRPKREALIYI